jgi:putative ABC transport system substrate-binding protein
MAVDMKRREFISIVGGATMWPLAVRAQPSEKMRRVGVLPTGYRQTDPEGQARIAAFRDTLGRLGWTDGRNVRVDVRWPGDESDRIRIAAVVDSAPDAILISGNAAMAILQELNKTTSTVFVQVSDPVGGGFVKSLSRPDGNLTGFQNFEPSMGGKWLGLLKEVAPTVMRAAVLVFSDTPVHLEFLRAAEAVAPSLGVQVSAISVRDSHEVERDILRFADSPNGGLVVLPHGVPAIYPFNYFATSGGLISYGFDQIEQWRGAAGYVDRILRGTKPADLPVQAPTKYELVVNLKAARALGLTISPSLLATAVQVIE